MPRHLAMISLLIAILLCGIPVSTSADTLIELPVLAAIRQNNLGVFEILMIWWDKKPEPDPVQLQWSRRRATGEHASGSHGAGLCLCS